MSVEIILGAAALVMILCVVCLALLGRMNDTSDNTGSETGIEQDRNINSFEGWK